MTKTQSIQLTVRDIVKSPEYQAAYAAIKRNVWGIDPYTSQAHGKPQSWFNLQLQEMQAKSIPETSWIYGHDLQTHILRQFFQELCLPKLTEDERQRILSVVELVGKRMQAYHIDPCSVEAAKFYPSYKKHAIISGHKDVLNFFVTCTTLEYHTFNKFYREQFNQGEEKMTEIQSQVPAQAELVHVPTLEESIKASLPKGKKALKEAEKQVELAEKESEKASRETKLYPPSHEGVFKATLGQLCPLDSTTIKNARLAMREINEQHLEHLLAVDDSELPPILVQNSNYGLIVVDGYHRFARAVRLARERAEARGVPADEIRRYIDSQPIEVVETNYTNDFDLLDAAFKANLAHGLPASTRSRSRYGLFLIERAKARGEELSIREAAKLAKVSHVALLHARDGLMGKSRKEKLEKMSDEMVDTSDEEQKLLDKSLKNSQKLFAAMRGLWKDFEGQSPESLALFLKDEKHSEDSDMLRYFGKVMEVLASMA